MNLHSSKKLLLIDSLYINISGGLRLLVYLVRELQKRNVLFYLLADTRCRGIFDNCKYVRYMNASLWERNHFYRTKASRFSSVLCFGNIPAPIKLDVPVYTYFHNINLLTLSEAQTPSNKVKSWLKREVFKYYKNNTDYWMVQTLNTANELIKHIYETPGKVKLMPFYELPEDLLLLRKINHGDDYVFVSDYTGAKGHEELLEAWGILHQRGLDRQLHLTVHERNVVFIEKINQAKARGVKVVNHGFVPFEQVFDLYRQSKAIIYPSHNESLGLGLVEAIEAGCDVIASDLPFTYSVCKPSLTFDPYSPESIVGAIMEYEKGESSKSKLLINNQIDKLIQLLIGEIEMS